MQLRAAADGTHPSVSVCHRSFTRLTNARSRRLLPHAGGERVLNIQRRLICKRRALLDELEAQFRLVAHQPLDGFVGGLAIRRRRP